MLTALNKLKVFTALNILTFWRIYLLGVKRNSSVYSGSYKKGFLSDELKPYTIIAGRQRSKTHLIHYVNSIVLLITYLYLNDPILLFVEKEYRCLHRESYTNRETIMYCFLQVLHFYVRDEFYTYIHKCIIQYEQSSMYSSVSLLVEFSIHTIRFSMR